VIVYALTFVKASVAASCAVMCTAGCMESRGPSHVSASNASTVNVPEAVQKNQRTLSAMQSRTLIAWTRRFRTCL